MVRRVNGRLLWLAGVALVALALAQPATAQSTGMIKGVVKDASGQPVDGAKVSIDLAEGMTRHFETKTNKKGEFVQIGLPSGRYTVTAEKEKLASPAAPAVVSLGRPAEVNLVVGGAGAPISKEAAAKNAELKKVPPVRPTITTRRLRASRRQRRLTRVASTATTTSGSCTRRRKSGIRRKRHTKRRSN